MASAAIVTAQREKVFMSLNGTGNNNDGEKRTGLRRTPHRDPGVGGLHVFTTEAAMIRTAGVLGNACTACTFPHAAVPTFASAAGYHVAWCAKPRQGRCEGCAGSSTSRRPRLHGAPTTRLAAARKGRWWTEQGESKMLGWHPRALPSAAMTC